MKREGRQHGMVRTYPILPSSLSLRPEPKYIHKFNSPPTAGLFTKVSTKPTNHSKFTGKCGKSKCTSCHVHPASKSKAKTKGTQKLRSSDKSNSWRVLNSGRGLKFSGFSATGILDQLAIDDEFDNYGDGDDDDDGSCNLIYPELIIDSENLSQGAEIVELDVYDGHDHHDVVVGDDHDDDNMSFCDVGFVWKQVDGDEGWCIVEEI